MAALRGAIHLGANSGYCLAKNRTFNVHWYSGSTSHINRVDCRQISQLVKPGKRAFLVDTLALVIFVYIDKSSPLF